MSHPQSRRINKLILRHAWLNLWDKHMTTGRINQVPTVGFITTDRERETVVVVVVVVERQYSSSQPASQPPHISSSPPPPPLLLLSHAFHTHRSTAPLRTHTQWLHVCTRCVHYGNMLHTHIHIHTRCPLYHHHLVRCGDIWENSASLV